MAQEIKALNMKAIDFVLSGDEEYWDIQQKLDQPDELDDAELAHLYGRFDENFRLFCSCQSFTTDGWSGLL